MISMLIGIMSDTHDDIAQTKRETMFIQLLEALHESEAELMCLVKDKQLHKRFKITKVVVQDAYPDIKWN